MASESSSNNPSASARSFLAVLALLLASPFAFLLGGSSSGGAPKSTPSSTTRPAPTAAPSSNAIEAPTSCVARFLQPLYDATATVPDNDTSSSVASVVENPSLPPELAKFAEELAAVRQSLLDTPCLGVDALIATIPDPRSAGLAYAFDTALQALRLGVEQAQPTPDAPHYYRDREWLPWSQGSGEGSNGDSDRCADDFPGLVLFRGGGTEKPRLLVLLLVGETPTTGVQPRAMQDALALSEILALGGRGEACRTDAQERCPLCTKIIGPTFSGGASSLRLALDQWTRGRSTRGATRIVTGSATGDSVARVLRGGDAPVRADVVTFESTTATAEATECAYYGFLTKRLGVDSERAATRDSDPNVTPSGALAPELLHGVAMLHESGTEFGTTSRSPRCGYQAEVDVSFPVHVAALRTAYDEADRRSEDPDPTIARPTSLQVSLAETGKDRSADADMSQITINARDVALTNVLGAISRDGVRHVGIQATDVVDAIFLARRIRDVAPDVRLAFFEADALLTHESFRRDLAGSLVVSPYPFLGTNDFARPTPRQFEVLFAPVEEPHRHMPFENSSAEGTFNAMLAIRGVPYGELREYTFDDEHRSPLPVWISTIGTRRIVPIAVTPPFDCDQTIIGKAADLDPSVSDRELCDTTLSNKESPGGKPAPAVALEQRRRAREKAWDGFYRMDAGTLELDDDAAPSRVWHFVYAALVVGFLLDWALQRRQRRRFSATPVPHALDKGPDERAMDDALLRAKWELYAFYRSYVVCFGLIYMNCVYVCVFHVYGVGWEKLILGSWLWAVFLAGLIQLFALRDTAHAFWRFLQDYATLAHRFRSASALSWLLGRIKVADLGPRLDVPEPVQRRTMKDCVKFAIGFGEPNTRWEAAQTSCAQIRALLTCSLLVIACFGYWIGAQAWAVLRDVFPTENAHATSALTLSILRHLLLVDDVSPAAPLLLCAVCVYVWAWGRMARIYVMHGLARLAPPDAMLDLVAIPLSVLCWAGVKREDRPAERREGLAEVERAVVNAITRPSTGIRYLLALSIVITFPILLFALKPLSTLETELGTRVMCAALILSEVLIGATLTQLIQYWLALHQLLRRLMENPVSRALEKIAPYARDSLVGVLSRPPDDLLRLAAGARDFAGLVMEARALGFSPLRCAIEEATRKHDEVDRARAAALTLDRGDGGALLFEREAKLGSSVISSAARLSKLLRRVSRGRLNGTGGAAPTAEKEAAVELSSNLTPVASKFSRQELVWLSHAESHVATVAALVVVRYVRNVRIFALTLTLCALTLLLTIVSYPFEPQRLLLTCLWVIMLSVVAVGLCVYVGLDQSGVMSRISGTQPGKVTLNGALAAHVVTWVVLPLVGVAAAQYPQVAKTLFQVVEPFAKALK